jgi:glucose-6-phosphate isomerase
MLSARLGEAGPAVASALAEAREAGVVERIWSRDTSLWSSDPEVRAKIANRLGWLDAPGWAAGRIDEFRRLAAEAEPQPHLLLLGMGGSSLAPEVLAHTFGSTRLRILDSTDPEQILAIEREIDVARTWFFVASKSGETIETRSHAAYFGEKANDPSRFNAVTDPGSPLATQASARGYRAVFENPPDIGGRFSALSYFGLVPAAAAGVDVHALLASAQRAAEECARDDDGNPGLALGVALGELARLGRDKVTFLYAPGVSSFEAWAEQLLAESTGKDGTGIIPTGARLRAGDRYGADRVFVQIRVRGHRGGASARQLGELVAAGHPLIEITVGDPTDLGWLFFTWEFATAVAGWRLGVNPFDEPNVSESKQNTARIIEGFEQTGSLPSSEPAAVTKGVELHGAEHAGSVADGLRPFFRNVRPGDYVCIQKFLPDVPGRSQAVGRAVRAISERLGVATTVGFGPRYLHSTGQLHKGGPPKGHFIQITAEHREDVAIPGQRYSFGVLEAAQAAGDLDSLARHGRPIVRLHVTGDMKRGLSALQKMIVEALP